MQNQKMLIIKISLLFLYCSLNLVAQTELFKSNLYISDDNLTKFYSSFSIDSTQIYVNSNDYYLHAFDKKTRVLNWSHYLANKTNTNPIVHKNSIIVGKHISEYYNKCVQLNCKTGDTIQTLKVDEIFNQPIFKDNIMFSTAITYEDGGCILAYDFNKNEIIWKQFIAHGVSTQPFFLKNEIVANVENDNWFTIGYNGVLKDTLCKNQGHTFVDNIKCVKNYITLSHDEKAIDFSFLSKNLGFYDTFHSKFYDNKTFLLGNQTLLILGNNKKILQKIDLEDIIISLDNNYSIYKTILKVENNTIWFIINNRIVNYDFHNKKVNAAFDVSKWNPHQLILEQNLCYLISRKDGQLYVLNLDFDKKAIDMQNAKIKMQKEINNYKPDLKKVKAAKEAEKNYTKKL